MFYAIEYAYGRNVINNGNRGDRVLEFTAKRLRDAWVAAGDFNVNDSGARDSLTARDSRVRGVEGLEDGDREGWRVMAENRVQNSAALRKHWAIIFYDWTEADHEKWVATAPERNIITWAVETEKNAEEIES